jgi:hypothetical protein
MAIAFVARQTPPFQSQGGFAVPATNQHRLTRSQKAARRSPNTWLNGNPQPASTRRVPLLPSGTDVVRFPATKTTRTRKVANQDPITLRLNGVQAAWSDRERAQRRIQAIRKQEELLLLLADAELEDGFRLAVADGEQPVMPPEIDVLRN